MIRLGIQHPQIVSRLPINCLRQNSIKVLYKAQYESSSILSKTFGNSSGMQILFYNKRSFSSTPISHFKCIYQLNHAHMSSSASKNDTITKSTKNVIPKSTAFKIIKTSTTPTAKKTVTKKLPTISELKILKDLFKYIWPKGNNKVRIRVIVALSLLIGAKILNVQVPFFFKQTIDSMNVDWSDSTVALPAAIILTILSYGVTRFGAVLFGELRNAVFSKVAQNAIRTVSLDTFKHLMKLDLG